MRTRVDIPKMRGGGASQEQEKTSRGDNNQGRKVVVVGTGERTGQKEQGGSSKRKKTEVRDTAKNSSSQGSNRNSSSQGSSQRVERNYSLQGSSQNLRGERSGSSRSEATTSAGRREAWVVSSNGSAIGEVNVEEEDLPRKKVPMEVTMRLPGGQMATVMYRVGADAEMRKVIDKVKVNVDSSLCTMYLSHAPPSGGQQTGQACVQSSSVLHWQHKLFD